jgi:hypothetical protein
MADLISSPPNSKALRVAPLTSRLWPHAAIVFYRFLESAKGKKPSFTDDLYVCRNHSGKSKFPIDFPGNGIRADRLAI